MKSRATTRFWFLYDQLPPSIKKLAVKNYYLWLVQSAASFPLLQETARSWRTGPVILGVGKPR